MANLRLVPASGSPIDIDKDEVVLGREPSCDIVVSDGSISRRHAKIQRRGDDWHVADQGSANGTFVDSQRVGEAELRHGQTLRFGAVDYKVELEEDLAATIAMPQEALKPPPKPPAPPAAPAPATPAAGSPAVPPRAPAASPPPPPPGRAAASAPPPPPPARPPAPGRAAAPTASPVRSMGPGGPPPAKKGKGPLFWGALGCCGCLLLAGLLGGGFFGFMFYATQEPVNAVQAMLKELREGQDQAAFARLSSGLQARLGPGGFSRLVAAHPGLRANADASFRNRSITNNRAVLKDVALTAATGEVETVTFELIEEGGGWKVDVVTFAAGPGTDSLPGSSGGLQIDDVSLTKSRDGEGIKVVIVLIASNYETRPQGDGFAMDIQEDVETLGPDGQRIESLSKENIERRDDQVAHTSPPPPQTFTTTLTVDPDNPPGLYTVRLAVHDKIAGASQTGVANFTLP